MNRKIFTVMCRNKLNVYFKNNSNRAVSSCKMSTSASISEIQRDKETFQDLFPTICDTIIKRSEFAQVPQAAEWMKKVLEYNVPGGKLSRGLTTTFTYESLASPDDFTQENLKISRIIGWCVEMLHSYFLVMDDIMDGSTKRRGQPCWYVLPDVGMTAINDSILIHACIFETLKVYGSHLPLYKQIMELFNETLLLTALGQYLDITVAHKNKDNFNLFTMEQYNSIIKHKTSIYTFKLPVCLGMLLANISDSNIHKKAENICLKLGYLFQIQDDFLDCYGAEHMIGKNGTDIQERKCSWLAVQALQRCTANQRNVFVCCYGSPEPAHIERIKRLYEELKLKEIFAQQERETYDEILRSIEELPTDTHLPELFVKLLNMTNKRKM